MGFIFDQLGKIKLPRFITYIRELEWKVSFFAVRSRLWPEFSASMASSTQTLRLVTNQGAVKFRTNLLDRRCFNNGVKKYINRQPAFRFESLNLKMSPSRARFNARPCQTRLLANRYCWWFQSMNMLRWESAKDFPNINFTLSRCDRYDLPNVQSVIFKEQWRIILVGCFGLPNVRLKPHGLVFYWCCMDIASYP